MSLQHICIPAESSWQRTLQVPRAHPVHACLQKAGGSARTEVYAIEEWERVQAEAALAKEQEEAILVSSAQGLCPAHDTSR